MAQATKCRVCGEYTYVTVNYRGYCKNPECGATSKKYVDEDGTGGKGERCNHCGKHTVFANMCNNPDCNARYY